MFTNIKYANDATNRFSFEINEVDLSLISAIRRTILTDIPVVGFICEDNVSVDILINTGALHNEFIIHRLGLIPICFNEDEIETFVSDDYRFELHVVNDNQQMINVTTHDFRIYKNNTPMPMKDIHRIFPVSPVSNRPILITRLRVGEELHIDGKAVKSTAREHAGFSPVSLCAHSFIQDDTLASKESNILNKEKAYKRNKYGDPTHVLFEIESECALTPKYLVLKAIEILMNKLHKVIQEINNSDSQYITLKKLDIGAEFTFQDEDDTLGNFLQSLMHNHYIRDKKPSAKDRNVSYIGYICPHPLDNIMNLKIVFDPDQDQNQDKIEDHEYTELLIEHCNRSLVYLHNIQVEWLKETSTL